MAASNWGSTGSTRHTLKQFAVADFTPAKVPRMATAETHLLDTLVDENWHLSNDELKTSAEGKKDVNLNALCEAEKKENL